MRSTGGIDPEMLARGTSHYKRKGSRDPSVRSKKTRTFGTTPLIDDAFYFGSGTSLESGTSPTPTIFDEVRNFL
jgi:hypothetical protein